MYTQNKFSVGSLHPRDATVGAFYIGGDVYFSYQK